MNGYMRVLGLILSAGLVSALAACGGVLPSKETAAPSAWESFDQAKANYDRIVPGETRADDLAQLGLNPMQTPNVRRLNYLELIEVFMPHISIQRGDLDPALRTCLEARESCYAYEVHPGITHEKRHGNAVLDIFGFRRDTQTSGWQFNSLIVLKDEIVAYKLWSGEPNIRREESERRPLGPLQHAGEKLIENAF